MLHLPKPVYIISLACALVMSGVPMFVLLGGIIGADFSPGPLWVTIPLSALVIGTAMCTLPAAKLIHLIGAKRGFLFGVSCALTANGLGIITVIYQSFYIWIFSAFFIGASIAFTQQMRFAVAEHVESHEIPTALSVFMLGGILAAILGPEIGERGAELFDVNYLGCFVILGFLNVIAAMLVFSVKSVVKIKTENQSKQIDTPFTQHWVMLAIASSVTAYGVMAYVMTATPVSMHVHHGFSLNDAKLVIQAHVVAMFLPALFTGKLLQRFGFYPVIIAGLCTFALTFVLTLSGYQFIHFGGGLILLGVGWNLLFTAGSSIIARYDYAESMRGQHDFWVFSIQAVVTLLAGAALMSLGWQGIQLTALLGLLPLSCLLIYLKAKKTV